MQISLISHTQNPNLTMATAARVCYSEAENFAEDRVLSALSEENAWSWLHQACLTKRHYSPLEHASFSFYCRDIVHDAVVQLRTHRHLQMQVQSMRYTGDRMADANNSSQTLFYCRSSIEADREGNRGILDCEEFYQYCDRARETYRTALKEGVPKEVARHLLPAGYYQNFVLSANLRALFGVFNMRTPKDAQYEVRILALGILEALSPVVPEAVIWYKEKFLGKNNLSF